MERFPGILKIFNNSKEISKTVRDLVRHWNISQNFKNYNRFLEILEDFHGFPEFLKDFKEIQGSLIIQQEFQQIIYDINGIQKISKSSHMIQKVSSNL